ncbi:MAG: flagellar hook-basal body complex protein FliE [SAR324 cluster bacterium]|nr:flagellar hook-basal body complex protein FliE [SAR324 cluster bacterium]
MAIQFNNNITPNLTPQRTSQTSSKTEVQSGSAFSPFEKMLEDTNQLQIEAEEKQTEFMTSGNKDIHGTMIAMQKAEVSLKLLMQVRNKLTAAYEEISRMQV